MFEIFYEPLPHRAGWEAICFPKVRDENLHIYEFAKNPIVAAATA
jgi:hypothetical protein